MERAESDPVRGDGDGPRSAPLVLVTGASSGIGLATADTLHAAGWIVVGASRRGAGGSGWQHESCDVTDPIAVAALVDTIVAGHGRLDAVVTCAGWGVAGPVEVSAIDEARDQFDTNFWGTVHVVRSALPHLRSSRGRIVAMSSLAGMIGIPFQSMYAASKFALEGWAESLAWEVAPFGVRVTLVQPGNFRTGFTDARRTETTDGPYAEASRRAVARMEQDERNGAAPDRVATTVFRVLTAARPPLRVSVGALAERSGAWAKRWLPFRIYARLARSALTG